MRGSADPKNSVTCQRVRAAPNCAAGTYLLPIVEGGSSTEHKAPRLQAEGMSGDVQVPLGPELVCLIEECDGPASAEDAVLLLRTHVELLVQGKLARVQT